VTMMRLSHAAALAMIGWYLMVPPHRICLTCSDYFQPRAQNLPLAEWETANHFDTLAECEASLDWKVKHNSRRFRLIKRARISYIAKYGLCVASDDLRLKEK